MINRIFCYSKEIAINYRNHRLPILEMVVTTIIFIIATIIMACYIAEIDFIFTLSFIMFIALIVYFSIILTKRMRNRTIAYATDTHGRIFKVIPPSNGIALYLGGLAVGNMIDQLADTTSNTGSNIGGAVGAAAQLYSMNRQANQMQNHEFIAKLIEQANNIPGILIYEILKVYSIMDTGKSIKVICDYKINNNHLKYQKTLTIEKSYNMLEELINLLNTHR